MVQNVSKMVKWQIFVKIRPTLAQIISGTKCDRDKLIFSAERGSQLDRVGHKKGTQSDRIMSKTGVNRAEVPHHVQVWECPPPLGFLLSDLPWSLKYRDVILSELSSNGVLFWTTVISTILWETRMVYYSHLLFLNFLQFTLLSCPNLGHLFHLCFSSYTPSLETQMENIDHFLFHPSS